MPASTGTRVSRRSGSVFALQAPRAPAQIGGVAARATSVAQRYGREVASAIPCACLEMADAFNALTLEFLREAGRCAS